MEAVFVLLGSAGGQADLRARADASMRRSPMLDAFATSAAEISGPNTSEVVRVQSSIQRAKWC